MPLIRATGTVHPHACWRARSPDFHARAERLRGSSPSLDLRTEINCRSAPACSCQSPETSRRTASTRSKSVLRSGHGAGLRVPRTILLHTPDDLKYERSPTLGETGSGSGPPRVAVAGGHCLSAVSTSRGHGSISTRGWGCFTAAQLLTDRSVTWQSIWYEGDLVVAQARRRHKWNYGNRTLSGVTGITGVAETCSDEDVTRTALDAIAAIDSRPHGIFCVDMTYDRSGVPNPTEINIGRFFTTVVFLHEGWPELSRDLLRSGPRWTISDARTGRSIRSRTAWSGFAAWTWRPCSQHERSWQDWTAAWWPVARTVVVTGARGFIGAATVRRLAALARYASRRPHPNAPAGHRRAERPMDRKLARGVDTVALVSRRLDVHRRGHSPGGVHAQECRDPRLRTGDYQREHRGHAGAARQPAASAAPLHLRQHA